MAQPWRCPSCRKPLGHVTHRGKPPGQDVLNLTDRFDRIDKQGRVWCECGAWRDGKAYKIHVSFLLWLRKKG
jgi:hypothetical protein